MLFRAGSPSLSGCGSHLQLLQSAYDSEGLRGVWLQSHPYHIFTVSCLSSARWHPWKDDFLCTLMSIQPGFPIHLGIFFCSMGIVLLGFQRSFKQDALPFDQIARPTLYPVSLLFFFFFQCRFLCCRARASRESAPCSVDRARQPAALFVRQNP